MTQAQQPEPNRNAYAAFEGTAPVGASHRLDLVALDAWLTAEVAGYAGPLEIAQFRGGQSNPTYQLITPARRYVLRAKPGPAAKLLPSAHAIDREYRVMAALADTAVPVPRMLALCEDEAVIGRAFYVMSHVEGRVLWDPALPGMTPAERAAHYDAMNGVIAELHRLDPAALGLADYGRPGNYFARQIARWSKQYAATETEPIEAMHRLIDWLPRHIPEVDPAHERTTIVHGDFRLDNLIFAPDEPRVLAVLDWELSTLGNPLADFAYHAMTWHTEPGRFRGIAGLDRAALGIPDEAAYIARYLARTGFEIDGDWHFYLAYNMFRIAAILQGIMKRVADGTAASARAVEAGRQARPMADLAWRYAQRVR